MLQPAWERCCARSWALRVSSKGTPGLGMPRSQNRRFSSGSSNPSRASSCAATVGLGGAPLSASPSGDMLSTSAPTPKGPARCSSLEYPLCRQSRLACQPCWPSAAAARPSSCQRGRARAPSCAHPTARAGPSAAPAWFCSRPGRGTREQSEAKPHVRERRKRAGAAAWHSAGEYRSRRAPPRPTPDPPRRAGRACHNTSP
jgi:hypothetical protein